MQVQIPVNFGHMIYCYNTFTKLCNVHKQVQ